MITPVVDSDDVITQIGETLKDLQGIVSGEASNLVYHWSTLKNKLQKDDRLDILTNLTYISLATTMLRLSFKGSLQSVFLMC